MGDIQFLVLVWVWSREHMVLCIMAMGQMLSDYRTAEPTFLGLGNLAGL